LLDCIERLAGNLRLSRFGLCRDFLTAQAENKRADAKKTKNKADIIHDEKGSEIIGFINIYKITNSKNYYVAKKLFVSKKWIPKNRQPTKRDGEFNTRIKTAIAQAAKRKYCKSETLNFTLI
jgi:hypothetical protein